MNKTYFVYIMTNKNHTVLYTGVTSDLEKRVHQHKHKLIEGFTSRYNVSKLVHYETTNNVAAAIEREKQIKNWKREWKIDLIDGNNSQWRDLLED